MQVTHTLIVIKSFLFLICPVYPSSASSVKIHRSSLSTDHPLASARAGSGHPSTRGVDCEAGTNNTFIFRSSKIPIQIYVYICFCVFTSCTIFRVNFHTGGLLGEYEVEGCNGTSPTLVLERDQTYTMIQAHQFSNPILHQETLNISCSRH